jgi:hypothetical protein
MMSSFKQDLELFKSLLYGNSAQKDLTTVLMYQRHFNHFSGTKRTSESREEDSQKYFKDSLNMTEPLQHNKRTFNLLIRPCDDASVSIKSRFFAATIEAIKNTNATHEEKLVILQCRFATSGTIQYAKLLSSLSSPPSNSSV